MSDMFDHEAEAFDQLCFDNERDAGGIGSTWHGAYRGSQRVQVVRRDSNQMFTFQGELISESAKAWYFETGAGTRRWYPKSRCQLIKGTGRAFDKLLVPEWLLRKLR